MKKNNKTLLIKIWNDFISFYKFDIFLAFLLLVLVAITASVYPYLIQLVFDGLISKKQDLWMNVPLIIACVAIIRGCAMFFQIKQVSKISLLISFDIQKKLSKHLIFSDLTELTKISSGNHVSRIMNDVALIRDGIERAINNLIRDTLTIFALFAYLIWIDWILSILVFLIYPIALNPIIKIGKRQRLFATKLQEEMENVTATLSEMLQGIRMVKSYNLEKMEIKRTSTVFNMLFDKMFSLVLGRAKILPILEILGGLTAASVIAIASYRVAQGQISPGSVVGFVTALLMVAQPARALGTFNTIAQEGFSALFRIYDQFEIYPKIKSKLNAPDLIIKNKDTNAIVFRDVSYAYNNKHNVINKISFTIKSGMNVALVGPSGSGKTTTINLVPRFYDPSFGKITVFDQDIRNVDLHSLRQNISLVSQETIIYNQSFLDNIKFGNLEASEEEVPQAAIKANLHDVIIKTPQGYNTVLGEGGNKLSGGQRQRLSIARAILKNSSILLLDEATSSLDSKTEKQINLAITKLTKYKTTLTVAHRLSTVINADMILLFDNGNIIASGKHDDLKNESALYEQLCTLQNLD